MIGGQLSEIQVVECPDLDDSTFYIAIDPAFGGEGRPVVMVGTKPPEEMDQIRREARLLVRRGLADVLEWLGQPVINEPIKALLKSRMHNTLDLRL